jgi:hypothetical protein
MERKFAYLYDEMMAVGCGLFACIPSLLLVTKMAVHLLYSFLALLVINML